MATQAEYQAIVNQAMEEARAQNTRLTSLESFVEELYKALRGMDIPPEQMAVAEQLLQTLKENAVKIEETFKENVPTP